MAYKHLVTGGSGFLGNLISKKLLKDNQKVKILDVWDSKDRESDIQFFNCDIRNRVKLNKILKDVDIVHHNVALVPLTKSGKEFHSVNVIGTKILAEECVKAGIKAIIHMSSSAVYGIPKHCPINYETPLNPIEIYGKAKLQGEIYMREICNRATLPLIIIRPRTILGKGRLGIFHILFEWINENRNIYTIGDGSGGFQFLHANDLIDAYSLILRQEKSGTFNVGAQEFSSLRDSLINLIDYRRSKSKVKKLPVSLTIGILKVLDKLSLSPLAPWHYLTYHKPFYFDIEKLIKLGWKPKYSNDKMLKESFKWYLDNKELKTNFENYSPHRSILKQGFLHILKKLS